MLHLPIRIDFTSVPARAIPHSNLSSIKKSKYAFLLFAISLKPLLFAVILSSFLFQPGTHPTGTYLYIIIPFHRKAMFSGKFSPPIRRVRIISPNQIFLPAEHQWFSITMLQRPPGSTPSVPAYISFSSALPLTHSVPHRTHSNRHPGSQGVPCLPQCSGVPHRNRSC